MKPEDLIVGRSYQYTEKYIEKYLSWADNQDSLRDLLVKTILIYKHYDLEKLTYTFTLVDCFTFCLSVKEEYLQNLEEKNI